MELKTRKTRSISPVVNNSWTTWPRSSCLTLSPTLKVLEHAVDRPTDPRNRGQWSTQECQDDYWFKLYDGNRSLIAKTLDKYLPHMNYEKVDGSVRKRNDLILRFQLNPTVRILIVNNKIGGQGLNLMQTPSLTLTVGTTKSSLISSLDALGDPDKSTQCLPTSSFATTRLTCISSNCALTSARTLKSSGRVPPCLCRHERR